jgi:hypothetical protein
MVKKNQKQKDIEFHNNLRPVSAFINRSITLNKKIWDINDSLGKINVMSRVSPSVQDNFHLSKSNRALMNTINTGNVKRCQNEGCHYFKKVQNLNDKAAYLIWKKLSDKDKSFYKEFASISPGRRHMMFSNYKSGGDLNF